MINQKQSHQSGQRSDFGTELRVSPVTISLLILVFASATPWVIHPYQLLLGFFSTPIITLLVASWPPTRAFARWILVFGMVGVIAQISVTDQLPAILALLVIPVSLVVVMVNLRAAGICAGIISAGLLITPGFFGAEGRMPEVIIALVGIWFVYAIMSGSYQRIYGFAHWSAEYYEKTLQMLQQALTTTLYYDETLKELAQANRQLVLSNERTAALRLLAEEAEKTKVAFVSKVSHEFRTPLNMIIGLIDLIVKSPEIYGQPFPPAAFEDLNVIYRNCEHLSALINDVLDLTQVESGRMRLRKERVDMASIVHEALGVVQPLINKKKLDFELLVKSDLPQVYCDRTRIRQVILNLLSNAARFTDRGGIKVRIDQKSNYIVVSVIDTGPGINPQDRESIFDPFCQGSQTLWLDKGGSGLGLTISKQFVELHGGRIWFDSALGEGTAFSFELPITDLILPTETPNRWIAEDWIWMEHFPTGKLPDLNPKPRVVVYDEVGELHNTLNRYSSEIEFVEVNSTTQAVEAQRKLPAHAVIVNLQAPVDLAQSVGSLSHDISNTAIVGCSIPSARKQAWEVHAVDYLIKPVTRDRLKQAVKKVPGSVVHVLIVDDDPDVVKLLTRMLFAFAPVLQVTSAASGVQAMQQMHLQLPDLILLDVILPDMDGWAFLKSKNAQEDLKYVPVIFVTAQDPNIQPPNSPTLVVGIDNGFSASKLLRCALSLSATLLQPD
jgi:signal transduction histidine kinase/CheY-like chemotaxis protein